MKVYCYDCKNFYDNEWGDWCYIGEHKSTPLCCVKVTYVPETKNYNNNCKDYQPSFLKRLKLSLGFIDRCA